jgi:hypothetical protein
MAIGPGADDVNQVRAVKERETLTAVEFDHFLREVHADHAHGTGGRFLWR